MNILKEIIKKREKKDRRVNGKEKKKKDLIKMSYNFIK